MADRQLGVIGAGNMAEALLRGALSAGVLSADAVVVSDPDPARRGLFADQLGVEAVDDNAVPGSCPRVLLAVKPQVMPDVLASIADVLNADTLVVSIAAGIKTAFLHAGLGGVGRIVRTMPNTPMLVKAGISALCPGPGATEDDLAWAEGLLGTCGKTVRVEEPMMDVVTAVSGSGPAYFFYLVEAMAAAAEAEGMDAKTALALAVETCVGAGRLLVDSGHPPEVLRAKVTSPGGTTQAAIESLESAGVKPALIAAVRRAAQRSRELGA